MMYSLAYRNVHVWICAQTFTAQNLLWSKDYQESTEHVETDEVDDGKATAAGSFLSGVVV